MESLNEKIRELAEANGIDVIGFGDASEFKDYYLTDSLRKDPSISLKDAKSIIVAGIYIGGLALPVWNDPRYGRTSRLYLSGYFLDVVKPLESIRSFLLNQGYKAIICDSSENERSILPLKLAAVRCGIGWQGKNSLLISRKFGTFLALGGIITNAITEINSKEEPDFCGNCNKCQIACPMSALQQPYTLNRKECLSYQFQTEYLSEAAKKISQNRIADCEICQDICPWNRKHIQNPVQTKLTVSFQKKLAGLKKHYYLPSLENLSEDEYKEELASVRTDIPYSAFFRNIKLALEHSRSHPK